MLGVFTDNYFLSVPLFRESKLLGILASGTIPSNRLLGCQLKSDKELKKEGRGSSDSKSLRMKMLSWFVGMTMDP